MARCVRVEFPGAVYHVINRWDWWELERRMEARRGGEEGRIFVTVAWIAERLHMSSVANVNTLLYRWRQKKQK